MAKWALFSVEKSIDVGKLFMKAKDAVDKKKEEKAEKQDKE